MENVLIPVVVAFLAICINPASRLERQAVEGIYTLTSLTWNDNACTPGVEILEDQEYRYILLIVFGSNIAAFLGTTVEECLELHGKMLNSEILFQCSRVVTVALISLAISFSVEFSQLYKAGWIDTIRSNRIGALFLGSGFLWSDLSCYTVGCIMGVAGDVLVSVLPSSEQM